MVTNAILPAIASSSSSISQMTQKVNSRQDTQVSVVYATAELDSNGDWQDGNSNGKFDVFVWVKNVGVNRIIGVDHSDIFIGTDGGVARIPYTADADGVYPQWSYSLENGAEWSSTVTAKIAISYSSPQASGTYYVKVLTPSGAYDESSFSF